MHFSFGGLSDNDTFIRPLVYRYYVTKSKGRSSQSRSVLFLSDMHVGSIYAVRSPDAVIEGGSGLKMTKFNEQMYQNWCNVRDNIQKKDIDVLCLNGEPIDGGNSKTNASGTWTSNIQHQLDDSERLIRMYKWKEIVMTRGSRYHVSVGNNFHEEILAAKLNARAYSGFFGTALENKKDGKTYDGNGNMQLTDFYLFFILGGKQFSVCHHVGYNKTELYRTTALGREQAVMEFARGKWYAKDTNIDVLVRSHVHYYVQVRYPGQIAFTTPCWKMPDEFMLRRGLGGTAVHLGAIEVIIETNGRIDVVEHIIQAKDYPKPQVINFDRLL